MTTEVEEQAAPMDDREKTLVLALMRATVRQDDPFVSELLAAADPAFVCRTMLEWARVDLIAVHGTADAAVAELDKLIRKLANGNGAATQVTTRRTL